MKVLKSKSKKNNIVKFIYPFCNLKKYAVFMLAIAVLSACKTRESVHLNVTLPAPVTLPVSIKKVGIINRSLSSKENKVNDVLDKVLSAEGPELDKEAAKEGVAGLKNELISNTRFTEVKALDAVLLTTPGAGNFPSPLGWEDVEKVCKENNVDALFALETFDTDAKINYSASSGSIKTPLGNVPTMETQATISTLIKTGWRIYDPQSRKMLDEFSIADNTSQTGRGITPMAAAAAIMGRKDAVKRASNDIGQRYGMRILPYTLNVSREYFIKGTNNFETAKRKAKTGNWEEAAQLWKQETNNPDPKLAGNAHYNMALACEIKGELDLAIDWAKKSYENYGNKTALKYVNILKGRKENNNVLDKQMEQ